MHPFSIHRFSKLITKTQHKIAAKYLYTIHECLQKNNSVEKHLSIYREIETVFALPVLQMQIEEISHRYHWHVQSAHLKNKETKLLDSISYGDQLSQEAFLPIDIYLDSLRSAYNVGSIIRITEAFRLGSLHFSATTPTDKHPKVQKTAKQAEYAVKCFYNTRVNQLKQPLIAIETSKTAKSICKYQFPKECTLILGNEEFGVSQALLEKTQDIVQIPLCGMKNSINVAAAFSIVAHTIRAQNPTT